MNEMPAYVMKMAALQEIKLFGCEVYQVGEGIVLTSCREKPALGVSLQGEEGIAIVLSGPAVDAWKRAGKQ